MAGAEAEDSTTVAASSTDADSTSNNLEQSLLRPSTAHDVSDQQQRQTLYQIIHYQTKKLVISTSDYIDSLPENVEVTIRMIATLILVCVLTLHPFPNAFPPSQVILVGAITIAFSMVVPSLLFIVGHTVFPGMIVVSVVSFGTCTLLLIVAATTGLGWFVVTFFFVALILSGLRFTKQGANTALLMVLLSLNAMTLAPTAAEQGLEYVGSLWTEKGISNPRAVFQSGIVGMCWLALMISFGRLLPPWRTARQLVTRKFLPKVLRTLSRFLLAIIEKHTEDRNEGQGDADGEDDSTFESISIDDLIVAVIQGESIVVGGGMAKLTAFEPRLERCCGTSSQVDIVSLLDQLINAVDDTTFHIMALRGFSKAGFEELDVPLKELYSESARMIDRCAVALEENEKVVETEESNQLPFDVMRINERVKKVEKLVNEWIDATSPVPFHGPHFDDSAWERYIRRIKPWLVDGIFGVTNAVGQCLVKIFMLDTWRRVFLPPHCDLPKFVWCLKYAIGFTALVCMQLYWPAFAKLELLSKNPEDAAHFSGWSLIAFSLATTQTTEGTFKKGMLRAVGTVTGAFFGWLALKIYGDSNAAALGIWMTFLGSLATYVGLPRDFSSRLGLKRDLAWGPAYFTMTLFLVVLEVYGGHGEAGQIALNRAIANLTGIGIAMILAILPPGLYGSSPRESKFLLEDKKRVYRETLELLLNGGDVTKLYTVHSVAESTFISGYIEASGNFDDSNQWQRLPILKSDQRLKYSLASSAILGSSILSLVRYAILLTETLGVELLPEGSEDRSILQSLLKCLDVEDDAYGTSTYNIRRSHAEGKTYARPSVLPAHNDHPSRLVSSQKTFVHYATWLLHWISVREERLDCIHFGLLGRGTTRTGRRTKLSEDICHAFTLYEHPEDVPFHSLDDHFRAGK